MSSYLFLHSNTTPKPPRPRHCTGWKSDRNLDANPELVMSTLETDWKLGSEAVDGG